jgi:hypothetical protein
VAHLPASLASINFTECEVHTCSRQKLRTTWIPTDRGLGAWLAWTIALHVYCARSLTDPLSSSPSLTSLPSSSIYTQHIQQ